ncbi:hypothetical protein GWL_07950 [Herbaspirillum sp. GW103]|nr:hypothetical protein GWL_07950 [Herbaspirillum sp. GW103]
MSGNRNALSYRITPPARRPGPGQCLTSCNMALERRGNSSFCRYFSSIPLL